MPPFSEISPNVRVPYQYIEMRAKGRNTRERPRNLIIGQKLAEGTANAGQPYRILSDSDLDLYFGAGSIAQQMGSVFRRNNPGADLFVIGLADADGNKASGAITVANATCTKTRSVALYVAGRLVPFTVVKGDAAAAIADKIVAAIMADKYCAVTAETDGLDVICTAKHKGTLGNAIDLRFNYLGNAGGEPDLDFGVSLTISPLSGGATDPSLELISTWIGDQPYRWIISPYYNSTALDFLATEMDRRWGATVQAYGHAFTAAPYASATAAVSAGSDRNDKHLTLWAFEGAGVSEGSPDPRPSGTPLGNPCSPWEVASAASAVVSRSAEIHAARPYCDLAVKGLRATPELDRWKFADHNALAYAGCSYLRYSPQGATRIGDVITNYQRNDAGSATDAYLSQNIVEQLQEIATIPAKVADRFPQHILAPDGVRFAPGTPVVTPSILRANTIAEYRIMAENGIVNDPEAFASLLTCEINGTNKDRADMYLAPDLTGQFKIGAWLIEFSKGITG